MNITAKLIVTAISCLVLGVLGGYAFRWANHDIGTPGDVAARQYQGLFEVIASRKGVAKTPEQVIIDAQNVLALHTIIVGQQFKTISDDRMLAEVVRITKLIDANPSLQAPLVNQSARWAANTRRCIVDKFSDKNAVVACVRNAENAMQVKGADRSAYSASK